MDMIEKVARAILATGYFEKDGWAWTDFTDEARAAIVAMREPTDNMVQSAVAADTDRDTYRAMIDAALKTAE